ncbi:hypothetical protein DRW03_25570 [Corallococcus sp. H22C18031201]|uniref:hypothetical protein n=1 Tax=Citreicoccus inhibens TaxID=2849499 RepID=UPI000E72B7E4|nr:hypothetical protein [Citreicoccus inhibens]MBU8898929.1 hypothetical protein [Citreicoccus inhibens]RJS18489.1 hypothetical protein DRW03_25570 [Corallococcus sp. H22C18031201]
MTMHERGIRRWSGAAVLVAGMLLGTACGDLPETGGRQPDESRGNAFAQRGTQPEALYNVAEQQGHESPAAAHEGHPAATLPPHVLTVDRGYNQTIKEIGSSIDPRTPQNEGKSNNSKFDDAGGMMRTRYAEFGGAEYSPTATGVGGQYVTDLRPHVRGYEENFVHEAVTPIYMRNR